MFDYSAHPELLKGRVILVTGALAASVPPPPEPILRMAQVSCCWAEPRPALPRSVTR